MSETLENVTDVSGLVLEQADRFLRQHVTKDRLEAADTGAWQAEIWQAVAEAGLPLALVPEAQGGIGLTPAVAMRLVRRAACFALPVPFGEAMLAAAFWAAASGEILDESASLAPVTSAGGFAVRRDGTNHVLDGCAARVPWGRDVETVLVHARDEAGADCLARVPRAAFRVTPSRNLANEPRDRLTAEDVELAEDAVRPAPPLPPGGFLTAGALLRAQQMVGAMERCLDLALAYANERSQFGRPIAKFQAVQHMLADAAGHYAAAAAAADAAAAAADMAAEAWDGDAEFATAVAKARAGEAAGKVAEVCHQVHGAMGFTQEHPLHFFTRRLWSWRDEFGNEARWQERIGRLVCAAGGEALWPRLAGA